MKYAERPTGGPGLRALVQRAVELGPRAATGRALAAGREQAARRATVAWRGAAGRVLARTPAREFHFGGERYRYVRHPHNATWRNERAVELPIVQRALAQADGPVLEVGNVLSHYGEWAHDVIDKYERAAGVRNVDVLDYAPARPYALIVSISTLEHVGWDDDDRDPGKPALAVAALRGMLAPGGRALVTVPLGYNPHLDAAVGVGELGFDRMSFLRRTAMTSWQETDYADVAGTAYGSPLPGANALVVGYVDGP